MDTKAIITLLTVLLSGCAMAPVATAPAPVAPVIATTPIFELRGDPRQIGTAHGQRFGEVIRMLHDQYLMPLLADESIGIEARIEAASFELYVLPEHRAELNALAEAAGISRLDAMLGQCFLDLMPQSGCSTIALPASASPDGVARMGGNLDFESLQIADKHSVVFIYHPDKRYQFAAIGWPGMIGVLSGMNEKGLCLRCMEVPRGARPASAMPYTLLYRTILEQCADVDEAIDLLRRTPRQTANNLMLMDAAGNRAVAEIRPEGVVVRPGRPGSALISTNHQRGENYDAPGLCWRYDKLHATSAAQFGHIGATDLETMLATVVQGSGGDFTIQSMVFEPANRVVYLAAGADAPARGYQRIDLRPYFAAEKYSSRQAGREPGGCENPAAIRLSTGTFATGWRIKACKINHYNDCGNGGLTLDFCVSSGNIGAVGTCLSRVPGDGIHEEPGFFTGRLPLGGIPEESAFLDVTPEISTALNRPSTPLDDLPFKRE